MGQIKNIKLHIVTDIKGSGMNRMEALPIEIFDQILSYCDRKDLVNMSCCSRHYNMNTNHLIWSKVQIFFCGCKRFKHPGRGNLFLTKELHLENTWYKNLHPNRYYHHKCSACT